MTVSDLLEQPCNKSDNAIKLVASCEQLVPNLLQQLGTISSLYVCMAIKHIIVLFVETPRKFIPAKLSIRKPGSSSVLIICDLFNSHALFIHKSGNKQCEHNLSTACEQICNNLEVKFEPFHIAYTKIKNLS